MEIKSNAVKPVGSIEEGWNLIKDDYWLFFAMTLVFILIIFAISFVIGLINGGITVGITTVLGMAKPEGTTAATVAAVAPQIISTTIGFFTNVILAAITGVLMCGIMNAFSRKAATGMVDFGDLFSGFDKFKSCLIYSIILSLVKYVVAIGAILIGVVFGVSLSASSLLKDGKLDPKIFTGLFGIIIVLGILALIINLAIAICTTFVYPLIAEHNLSGTGALMTSIRGALNNIIPLIGFFIMQILISLGGVLLCLVGVLFVVPVLYASIFTAYRSVFGVPTTNFMNQQPPPPPIFYN
jgi:hypothetical protein